MLSLLLVTVTMALLRRRRYAWLPVVFWFWANLHGAVLLGVLLLGAGLVAVLVEEIDAFPRLLLVSALCVLATALTPLGWQFWLDMPRSLGRIRQLGIDEWAAPRLASLSLLPFWWVAIGALTGLTAARGRALLQDPIARREGQNHDVRLRARARSLALTAVRNVPPFLMLAVPALAALLPQDLRRHNLKFARASAAECDDSRSSRRHCRRCRRRCVQDSPVAIQLVAAAGAIDKRA